MKKRIQFLLLLGLMAGCSKDEAITLPGNLDAPAAMNVFCQNTPDDALRRVEYQYENKNLVSEITTHNGKIYSETEFLYNSDNLLTQKVYKAGRRITEETYVYNELGQLINTIQKTTNFDDNGQVISETISEAPREFKNNLMVKEWTYWGSFRTYEYEDGKVVTMIDHNKSGNKHHITKYKYSGGFKIEERKETATGSEIYFRTFEYDPERRLITIIEDGNIIEENFYNGKKLTEKRTFYFGIDPGFDVCYGNYIYRYEY